MLLTLFILHSCGPHAPTAMQHTQPMSPRKSIASEESLEEAKGRSFVAEAASPLPNMSANSTATAGFHSPDNANTASSNPLRRSLILRLDQERREHIETMEKDAEQDTNVTDPSCFLPEDTSLELDALDLSNHHCRPRLRLRPVNSQDMEEYCDTCGGSTAPFHTPKQLRSSIPPRQEQRANANANHASAIPYCTCHVPGTTATTNEPASGQRLSFVHMTSPLHNSQLVMAVGQKADSSTESLQLQLLLSSDDDDETDGTTSSQHNGPSAFRKRVILQPKAIHQCHSHPPPFLSSDVASLQDAPTSTHSAPHHHHHQPPPGLLNASLESSASTSPEENVHRPFYQFSTRSAMNNSTRVDTAFHPPPPSQQQRHVNTTFTDIQEDTTTTINNTTTTMMNSVPLLPTMATPETIRPLFQSIALAPHPSNHQGDDTMDCLHQDGLTLDFSSSLPLAGSVENVNENASNSDEDEPSDC